MNEAAKCMITVDEAVLLMIDMQNKLLPVMNDRESLVQNISHLIRGCQLLGVPLLYSEQYPQGLGRTTPEILQWLPSDGCVEKIVFSAFREPLFREKLERAGRKKVIIAGIESHVCVVQTALDLLANGYEVFAPVDAVSSRTDANRRIGLSLMERAGGVLTSVEAVVFQLFERAGGDAFKEFQRMIR